MRKTVFFICLFVCCALAAQENFVFSPINSTNGLSDNRVRLICQLPDGRMVIVTEGLVNIYDGASFHYMHYNEQKAYFLKNYTGYHHAYVDNENHLWLKNQQKLMLFDIRTELFIPNIDSVCKAQGIKDRVVDFFVDTENNVWYVTENDELMFRNGRDKITSTFIPRVSEINGVTDLLYDVTIREKQLFLFHKSGTMVCYDFDTHKERYRENPFYGKENIYAQTLMVVPYKQYLYQARDGVNTGQLLRFNMLNRKWERILETNYWLNTLTIDNQGDCWISSFAGLWHIDEKLQDKHLISPLHLVDGRVFDSEICTQYNDNKGGLWVGTVNRGVLYYHPERFKFRNFGRSLFTQPGTDNLNVHCFTEKDGYILVGTQNGLFRYEKNAPTLEQFEAIPTNAQCEMLFRDSKQRIWVCTRNNGLYCINKNKVKHYSDPAYCLSIYEAFDGRLFLCTNHGVGIFDPETGNYEQPTFPTSRDVNFVYQLTGYRQDTLLGYNNHGLFLFDSRNSSISLPEKKNNILQHTNHRYHSLFTDSRGLIWIGTMDGLNVYHPTYNTTRSFFEENGLVNNSIRSIVEDNSGRIWVSTSNGISRIDITENKGIYNYSIYNFNRFDGTIENEFLPRSVYKTSDNRLLWGGLDGFNEIDLNRIDSSRQHVLVPLFTKFFLSGTEIKLGEQYEGITLLKQSISSTKEIKLKHFQNFVGFEFSALNYVNPTQTYYRYMLEGADNSWHETKTTDGIGRINYTNLLPGKYRLRVFAANNNRQWGNRCAEIIIVIQPPFWKNLWAYASYVLGLILVLYFTFSYYFRQNRQKMLRQQKEELDHLKFSFFTNISHELRTPLTLILTPLGSIMKKTGDETLKKQLHGIYRNANELLKLVNQLLDFRKLEMKGESLQLTYCNICEFLGAIALSFKELAADHEIELSFECQARDLYAFIDKDKLQKIVNNLLSNAMKFTPKEGHVWLRLEKNPSETEFKIHVTDTGCGIPEVDLTQIFERFYQVKKQHSTNTGSGIGLHIVKEYAQLLNGSIAVESRMNEGSKFTVSIPANLHPETENYSDPEVKPEKHIISLLVVDDNKEFRTFLQHELSEKYNILVAANGKEGLNTARKDLPDLVITDVMMPEMSGTELCRLLKNDIQISHIPVILLTAKASDNAQIEGFEAGADAYITKPFNMDILLLRIRHLIEQQEQRKSLFKNTVVINPEAITSTNVDEELIKKALGHIEKNIANTSYSVELLSKDMFMDRTGLYRKLVAIVGQTPTEFIRSVRLKKAAKMLESGIQVSEVSERVGFTTTSYFAKCFQDEFGVKPSHYKHKGK